MAEIHRMPNYIEAKPLPRRIGFPTPAFVAEVAAEGFGLPLDELVGPDTSKPLPRYRAAVYAAMSEACEVGQPRIATFFNRDNQTIRNGLRMVDRDPLLQGWCMRIVLEARQRWVA